MPRTSPHWCTDSAGRVLLHLCAPSLTGYSSEHCKREHAKSWGAAPRSGTSRARRRGEDGPKAVRRVRLAMELPQLGVPMEISPPRFCMLSFSPCAWALVRV